MSDYRDGYRHGKEKEKEEMSEKISKTLSEIRKEYNKLHETDVTARVCLARAYAEISKLLDIEL